MIEIRAQAPDDWRDIYQLRVAAADRIPYLRPDWVKEEVAQPSDNTWPMVAVRQVDDHRPRVVARADLKLPRARLGHLASLTLEQHPALAGDATGQLLSEAIQVAEGWWNRRRLQTVLPTTDSAAIELFGTHGFVQEARLRQSVRIAGTLVDELVLARVTGDAALPDQEPPPPPPHRRRPKRRIQVRVRGGGGDDWEAFHAIWNQPGVYWGTLAVPYRSAESDRRRVQHPPERFWSLVAEFEGQVVGNSGLFVDELNRSHVGHVGMMVHEDYQGMGVGSALMEAVIDLAEGWLGLSRLQLEVYTDNHRAIQLYRKAGFKEEGIWRAYVFRAGHYVDTLVMGRLRDESD